MSLIDTREIATAKIVMLSNGGGASSLNDLSDVNIYDVSNGQVLEFNSTSGKWENKNGYAGLGIGKKKSVSNNTIITDIDLHREPVAGDRLLIYFDTTVQNPTGLTTYNNGTAVTKNLENVSPLYYNAGWNVSEFKNDGLLYNNVWVRVQNVPVINYNAGSGISIDNGTIINTRRGALTGAIDSISSGYAHVLMSGARDTFAAGALIVVQAEVSGSATNLRIQYGSQASDSQDFRFYDTDGETLSLSVSRGNTIIAMIDNTGYRAIVLKVLDIEAQVGEPVRELRKLKIDGVVYDTDGMRTYEASNVANNNITLSVINAYQFVQKVIAINTGAHSGSSSAWNLVISDGMEVANVALKNADGSPFADDIHENELLFVYVDTAGNIARVLEIHSHDVEVLKDICITEKTATGNPLTVTDTLPYPAVSLSAEIEPSQDLHGYDHPWAGGAGKNKLPMTVAAIKAANTDGTWSGNVYIINGGTITILTDSDNNVTGIKTNGTFNASVTFVIAYYNCFLAADTYIFGAAQHSNDMYGGANNHYYFLSNVNGTSSWVAASHLGLSTRTFAVTDPTKGIRCGFYIESGVSINNELSYPMIRLSSVTDDLFAPYSNICPISGRTEARVDDVGKNRFSPTIVWKRNNNSSFGGATVDDNNTRARTTPAFAFDRVGTFTLSGLPSQVTSLITVACFDSNQNLIGNATISGFTFTTLANTKYIYILLGGSGFNSITFDSSKMQIEEGSTATAYEPYKSSSATIQLGTTVYGGEVDFDTGVLTVTDAFVTYDGSNDEYWSSDNSRLALYGASSGGIAELVKIPINNNTAAEIISNQYPTKTANETYTHIIGISIQAVQGYLYIYDDKYTTSADISSWKTYLASNPLQVCYKLATPTTLQLTPTQLTMLKGYNRLSSDGGGDITLTYKADRLAAIEAALAAL